MNEFNLFIKTLASYHNRCVEYDLPINMINPILVQIDYLFGQLNYNEENIDKRLILLCSRIKKIAPEDSGLEAFLMYAIVTYIDQKHDFLIRHCDDIVRASSETATLEDEKDDDNYWLTAWRPSRVALNPKLFIEKINSSKGIWETESKLLCEALHNIIFMPPFSISKTWSLMRCEEP